VNTDSTWQVEDWRDYRDNSHQKTMTLSADELIHRFLLHVLPSGFHSAESLKTAWQGINQKLWGGFAKLSPSDWTKRHTAVSEEDFEREPHRNRFAVLLGRTAHLAYRLGQATLARPKT
jgi:hypothetical protein